MSKTPVKLLKISIASVLYIAIVILIPVEYVIILWIISLLYLITCTSIISSKNDKKYVGWLIDIRKRYSLSRLQMSFWTFLVLSSLLTAVIINIKAEFALEALVINIPEEILLAMGISYGSGIGSYYILRIYGYFNTTDESPLLSNIYTTETENGSDDIDFTRLQNLYITIILCVLYGITIISTFSQAVKIGPLPIDKFPDFSSSLIVLLTASHAGYLGKKIAYGNKNHKVDGASEGTVEGDK